MEKKMTKRENFVLIAEALREDNLDDLAGVIEHEIELLDKKAASAKASAAKSKAASDALADAVLAALTDEPTLIADIVPKVEGSDVTLSKVTYRLSKLVEQGLATKSELAVAGGAGSKTRRLAAYSLA